MFTLCGGYWWVRDLSVILLAYFEVLNVQKEKNCKYITSKLKKNKNTKIRWGQDHQSSKQLSMDPQDMHMPTTHQRNDY